MTTLLKKWLGFPTTKESQKSPTSVQETESSSTSLSIEREIIDETPFTIVGTPKDGYWLTMGKHRLSKKHKTKKEVKQLIEKPTWQLINSVVIALIYDRKLIDKAYARNTEIPPDEKTATIASNHI